MSGVERAIEGELVQIRAVPVPVELQTREMRPVRPVPQALTWLGAALVFAGREIVPRVAASLLDAWDRRASLSMPSSSDSISMRSARGMAANSTDGGGRRHRWRRGRGGR